MPLDAVDVGWCPDEEAITWGVVISGARKNGRRLYASSGEIEGDFGGENGGGRVRVEAGRRKGLASRRERGLKSFGQSLKYIYVAKPVWPIILSILATVSPYRRGFLAHKNHRLRR